MKKSTLFFVFSLFLTGILPGISLAQQPAPLRYVVFEEKVATSDMAAFHKVQQETVDVWNKLKLDVPISCYSTDDNGFFWVIPAVNMASVDTIFAKSSAFMKRAKEQDSNYGAGFRDLSTANFSFISWRPDLSYHAATYSGPSDDMPYVEWSFCYMRQGHEEEATVAIKKFVDFYKKNRIDYNWDFFEVLLGYDTPVWVGMNVDTDVITMRQTEKSLDEKYGPQFKEMWADFTKHVRRIEIKTGKYMPRWSINLTD